MNRNDADLGAFSRVYQFRCLDGCILAGAHDYDQVFRVFRSVVIEQMIFTAGDLADLGHVILNDFRNRFIILVDGFAALEVGVRILGGAPHYRSVRVQAPLAERFYSFPVQHFRIILIIKYFNLLDFMRGTEPVKEVQEGNAALDGSQMGHAGQVHNFLHAAFRQHGETGLAAGQHVLVVAEDAEGAGSQGAGRYVEYGRQQLAGNFIHVRNHQQQALGSRVGSSQGACLQGSVYCACGTGLGLHLQ